MLEGVLNVQEGGQLLSTYEPEDGQLPALRGQVITRRIRRMCRTPLTVAAWSEIIAVAVHQQQSLAAVNVRA
jgi:hypothetical protein